MSKTIDMNQAVTPELPDLVLDRAEWVRGAGASECVYTYAAEGEWDDAYGFSDMDAFLKKTNDEVLKSSADKLHALRAGDSIDFDMGDGTTATVRCNF